MFSMPDVVISINVHGTEWLTDEFDQWVPWSQQVSAYKKQLKCIIKQGRFEDVVRLPVFF